MAVEVHGSSRAPRLNPFVFPSDTDVRFVLLVVSVLGSSLFIFHYLYIGFLGSVYAEAAKRCTARAEASDVGTAANSPSVIQQQVAENQAYMSCIDAFDRPQVIWITCGIALLLFVAGMTYLLLPALKIRRDRLIPLTDERVPGVGGYLQELCREAGLSRSPTFLVSPRNASASGVAFGRVGRRYVSLNIGLIMKYYTDRSTFRAVVLHELAHLRNSDIDKTYFTVAIGFAFAIAALLPIAAYFVYDQFRGKGDPGFVFALGWRVLALAMLVYLTLAAILRAREMYADVRASAWDGPSGALTRALSTEQRPDGGRWLSLRRLHPDPQRRLRAIAEPEMLFRLGFWDAFAGGLLAMVIVSELETVLHMVIPSPLALWVPMATVLLVAPLGIGVVGLGVWRGTFAAVARSETPRGSGVLGLGLGLGVLAGASLSLDSAVESGAGIAGVASADLAFRTLLAALVLIGLYWFARWISTGAATWLPGVATKRSLRLRVVMGLVVAVLLSTVCLGSLLLLRNIATFGNPMEMFILTGDQTSTRFDGNTIVIAFLGLSVLLESPLLLLVLAGLWAFPLIPGLWPRRPARTSATQWAFLDPPLQTYVLLRQHDFRLKSSFVTGVLGGLAFCVLYIIFLLAWRYGVSDAARSTDGATLALGAYSVILAIFVETIIAAIVAARVKSLGVHHGLFAAFVAGCLMTLVILGMNLAFGGEIDLFFAWTVFSAVLNGGALLALPLAGGISALMASQLGRTFTSPLWWLAPAGVTALVVLVVTGLALNAGRHSDLAAGNSADTSNGALGGMETNTARSHVLYSDDFSEASGWYEGRSRYDGSYYAGGSYHLYAAPYTSSVPYGAPVLDPISDVIVEVDATINSGQPNSAAAGIVCRLPRSSESKPSYYLMEVYGDGYADIVKWEKGKYSELAGGFHRNVAGAGEKSFHIRGDCRDDKLTLYINGQKVEEVKESELETGTVGLSIANIRRDAGRAHASFDNFLVRTPPPSSQEAEVR